MAEIQGTLIKLYPPEDVGQHVKQSFVIKTNGEYPKDICFEAWNKTTEYLTKFRVDDKLTVSYDISSREHNGRWYTTAKAFKIVKDSAQGGAVGNREDWSKPPIDNTSPDLPFSKPNMECDV